MSDFLADRLLAWYDIHARVLPWRSDPSPYHVWVSEIMLQQTRVDTVIPYYTRWITRFPTLESLASADQNEVLQLWEGLGYYGRARNLHKSAQLIVSQHAGNLPQDFKELLSLPGIGRYTAGAILSIAFNQSAPAVDGNIRRIYSRLINCHEPIGTPKNDNLICQFAKSVLPQNRPGDFNQALMDLGSACCLPDNPLCERCPIQIDCLAFSHKTQSILPVKPQKQPIPHWVVGAGVIMQDSHVLLAKRPQKGLLGGMWEFPGGKLEVEDPTLQACVQREWMEELGVNILAGDLVGTYSHAYTHFKVEVHAFLCQLAPGETILESETVRWVDLSELDAFPMGKVDRRIANRLVETNNNHHSV